MIDLYLPPKPAIIRPAPLQKASFLPGWFPSPVMAADRAVEVTWQFQGHNPNDNPPWNFNNVPIGDAHPLRYVVIFQSFVVDSDTVANVNGVAATYINNGESSSVKTWWIAPIPTGTTFTLQIAAPGSLSVHCSVEVWTLLYLKSTTPVATFRHASQSNDDPKSGTIAVLNGGAVVAACAGGELPASSLTWAFGGGLSTDHSGSTSGTSSIGAGHGSPLADNAALTISADRSGANYNYGFSGVSFR